MNQHKFEIYVSNYYERVTGGRLPNRFMLQKLFNTFQNYKTHIKITLKDRLTLLNESFEEWGCYQDQRGKDSFKYLHGIFIKMIDAKEIELHKVEKAVEQKQAQVDRINKQKEEDEAFKKEIEDLKELFRNNLHKFDQEEITLITNMIRNEQFISVRSHLIKKGVTT